MAKAPSTDNYTLGKGVVSFNQKNALSGLFDGERDLGNAPSFAFNITLEELEHFSSRGGLKALDKKLISQITPTVTFTLDEISADNIAFLSLGETEDIVQGSGAVVGETITVNHGRRSNVDFRAIGQLYNIPYDDALADNVSFVVGETVTGAVGEGIVVAVTGDASVGTLTVVLVTPGFADDETIIGDATGSAEVNSATGEVVSTGSGVFITNTAGDVTYVEGVDYKIDKTLKDDKIGRVLWLEGATAVDKSDALITYGYAEAAYKRIAALSQTQMEGEIHFVSDNPAGMDLELRAWRCSVVPSGDTPLIGDDWSTLTFSAQVLKDEESHPDCPYMEFIMD